MREPPNLAQDAISTALRAEYGLTADAVTFLPLGADSASAVYRVDAASTTYLLKVRTARGFGAASLAIPHYLHAQGVPHVVAPIATAEGSLSASVDGFALSLFPFLDVRAGADAGLSDENWRELGATLKRIHASTLPPDLRRIVGSEQFTPSRRSVLDDLEAAVAKQAFGNDVERELAAFWQARRDDIWQVVRRSDALARCLRQRSLPKVLCHADFHTWNVLVDADGQLQIVDWDEVVFAPKERDLMFVVGGIGRDLVSPQETACFLQGYGETSIDPQALAYYRYAWAVQDMGAYGEQVFFALDAGDESRRDAVRGFVDMFESGNIVDIACASE